MEDLHQRQVWQVRVFYKNLAPCYEAAQAMFKAALEKAGVIFSCRGHSQDFLLASIEVKSEAMLIVSMFNRLFPGPIQTEEYDSPKLRRQAAHAQSVLEVQAHWLDGEWILLESEEEYIF